MTTTTEQLTTLCGKLGTLPMSPNEAIRLQEGDLIHVLHENAGADQHDVEVNMPAGAIARVYKAFYLKGEFAKGSDLRGCIELLYPNGIHGYWETTDEDVFLFAQVTAPALLKEARSAFAAFDENDTPTPTRRQPRLWAIIGEPWGEDGKPHVEPVDTLETEDGMTVTVRQLDDDRAAFTWRVLKAYDDGLNELGIAPTGDDYNDALKLAEAALDGATILTFDIERGGR